ncbi:hypothetical protein [Ferrovibrio xuzhouensis]|uniref:HTH cro/C1-type domain-containing protein n=1 Tax=Ferrovibrio xuzhouensis TaxID=1576914 RepID=A0ABV7VE60_9PROT
MDSKQTAARNVALAMVGQVEHQALDIAGAYRDGAGINDRFGDFRAFVDKLGQFQVFVDLVEDRLSDLEPEKRDLQARNLANIRWRVLLLEIVAVRVFLERVAASGKPWPLGSHSFLVRRQDRLGEITAFHTQYGAQYGLTAPDAGLLQSVRDALQQQLGNSQGLEDFATAPAQAFMPAEDFAASPRPAPRPAVRKPVIRKPPAPPAAPVIPEAALALPIQHGQGGEDHYLQDSANGVVSEACRMAQISLDELATRLNTSRSSLVLMLNGRDQITTPSLNHLRAFVKQHLKAGAA